MITSRLKNKILESVERLSLDLTGKVVLTEAATGAYVVTPILAALAGAKVFAFTRTTRYGTIEEVKDQTFKLLSEIGGRTGSLEIVDELTPEIISQADVITNSGHLRPLNAEKLSHAKKSVVIPLMYEGWEWREGDLDNNFCKANSIRVGATNERHPDVDVFSYLGDMAIKQIFDAGLNPYKNSFVLVCNNDFGPFIAKALVKICGSLGVCDKAEHKDRYAGIGIDWVGNFPNLDASEKYKKCDAIIFTAYPFDKNWIGNQSEPISVKTLRQKFDSPFILRYAGDINEQDCKGQVEFFPAHVHSGHMGILPSAIGFDPIIRLQSGGLKVAELLMAGKTDFNDQVLVEKMDFLR